MMQPFSIRPLAVVVIRQGNLILAGSGHDDTKNDDFYRLPGGGIEMGETSLEALKREIREEFAAELKNIKFLKVVENIFTFNGQLGHEICFIYQADFVDQSLYQKSVFNILDSQLGHTATWIPADQTARIYPSGALV